MMRHFVFLLVLLWFAGCGETHTNDPLAGDIERIEVDVNQTKMYATRSVLATATAYYTLGVPERNVTEYIEWASSNTTIADFDDIGIVGGRESGGNVTIMGRFDEFEDGKQIEVIALVSARILPPESNLSREQTLQLKVEGTFADGKVLEVGEAMSWTLGGTADSNASIDQNGTLYTGDFNGTLEVNVSRYDVNDSLRLYVAP